jgi:tetratricopeptide (TPR) repeat protein
VGAVSADRRPRRRVAVRVARCVLAAGLIAVAGCGDSALWARYRAEKSYWHARRLAERLQLNPALATDADYERAMAAFREITRAFPPGVWAGTGEGPMALEVGEVSGRAAIACARIEEMRGHEKLALAGYARAISDYRTLGSVGVEAAAARAELLSELGRGPDALAAWSVVAADYPPVDPARHVASQAVLDAPLRIAALLDAAGRDAARDSVLRAADRRLLDGLAGARGTRAAPDLWLALAATRTARGDGDGALAALRGVLGEPADRANASRRVMTLARTALESGRPDTARVYAAWAAIGAAPADRADAMLILARAWEASHRPDSALAAFGRLLEACPEAQDPAAEARFRRGAILEAAGSWEAARSEYRALAAARPTHPLAFESVLRIVRYHLHRGEIEIARVEARRALENMDYLIATQRDDEVQQLARRTRADLLVALGDSTGACDALADLWRRYAGTTAGAEAGMRAAGIAESTLVDRGRARGLYRDIAERATDPGSRQRARAAAARLGQD